MNRPGRPRRGPRVSRAAAAALCIAWSPFARAAGPAAVFTPSSGSSFTNGHWELEEAGRLLAAARFPTNGVYTFVVLTAGTPVGSQWPAVGIEVDFQTIGELRLQSADWSTHTVSAFVATGVHDVVISLRGGVRGPAGTNRVAVSSVTIIGPTSAEEVSWTNRPGDDAWAARDALWRETADARIRSLRRGRLSVWVSDAGDRPVTNAQVEVRQLRHEFRFGAAVCPAAFTGAASAEYLRVLASNFNCAAVGEAIRWPVMETNAGQTAWSAADGVIGWCVTNGLVVRGNALLNGCDLPEWTTPLSGDELSGMLVARISAVASRYRGRMNEIVLLDRPLQCRALLESLGHSGLPWIFVEARNNNLDASLWVDESGIVSGDRVPELLEMARRIAKRGIIEMQGVGALVSLAERIPPERIWESLDPFSRTNLRVRITGFECDLPDEQRQARMTEETLRAVFSHPACDGIILRGFWEGAHPHPQAALWRTDFSPKPSAGIYQRLVGEEWRTVESGVTDRAGQFECLAFFGDYDVRVRAADGRTAATTAFLSRESGYGLAKVVLGALPEPANAPAGR